MIRKKELDGVLTIKISYNFKTYEDALVLANEIGEGIKQLQQVQREIRYEIKKLRK